MDWLGLTLICAFSLATADAYTKKHLSHYSGLEMVLIRFFIPGLMLFPLSFVYQLPPVPTEFWVWICILIPFEIVAMLYYMLAIRDAPLYQTLPFLAFTPVFNIATGWLILGEQISMYGVIGIALVVVGAYLLNIHTLADNNKANWLEPFLAIFYQKGSRRMLVVALLYSFTSVGGKAAMLHVGGINFAVVYIPLVGLAALILVLVVQPKGVSVLKQNYRWHIFIAVMFVIMLFTHFVALEKVEAAYMVAVKRTSLLFGIIYGAWLFHEKGIFHHFLSVSLMVAGVTIIVLN